ncbi:sirohydrochlorin cobaltochelatase [Clostridium thermobutyricum]|uniref:sirohydrochlorin cobaltochelatase n=1 Tax=Clostridium thermobutyricum TaxID=29372 RepID=UPI003F51CA0B
MKECILVSAFGTSNIEGYEKQFKPFLEKIKEEFSIDSFVGFTSNRIIDKLKDDRVKSLEDKIEEIKALGYEKLILVKLVLSDGKENRKIDELINKNKINFKEIIVTNPILSYKKDFIENCLTSDRCTILISHGREDGLIDKISDDFKFEIEKNYDNLKYLSLNRKEESKNVIENLLSIGINNVKFKPLLLTKGYHFSKDIYSEKDESFKKIFVNNNITVEEVNFGLLEDSRFIEFIINKISKLI